MLTTLRLGYDMIDVLGMLSAVLTTMPITKKDRPTRQWRRSPIRNCDIATETDNRRNVERQALGAPGAF